MKSQYQSKRRVVFATVALGMGVDIPCIRHVIHVGPPHAVRELKNIRMLKQLKKRIIRRRHRWVNPGRTDRWWQNLWSGRLLENEWPLNLRMSRPHFVELVEMVRPHLEAKSGNFHLDALSVKKRVMAL